MPRVRLGIHPAPPTRLAPIEKLISDQLFAVVLLPALSEIKPPAPFSAMISVGETLGSSRPPTPALIALFLRKETFMTDKMPDFSNVKGGSSSTATKIYEVVAGDSLSKIAKREYGNASEWKRIFEANKDIIKNPDLIYPGQKLKIPPK
jgi:nucleoid-associated protein YgaU